MTTDFVSGMRLPHRWKLPVTDGVERYHMLLCMVALIVLAGVISFLIYVSTDEGREARTYRNSPLGQSCSRFSQSSSLISQS